MQAFAGQAANVFDYYADLLTLMLDVDYFVHMMFFALVQATRSRVCTGMNVYPPCPHMW